MRESLTPISVEKGYSNFQGVSSSTVRSSLTESHCSLKVKTWKSGEPSQDWLVNQNYSECISISSKRPKETVTTWINMEAIFKCPTLVVSGSRANNDLSQRMAPDIHQTINRRKWTYLKRTVVRRDLLISMVDHVWLSFWEWIIIKGSIVSTHYWLLLKLKWLTFVTLLSCMFWMFHCLYTPTSREYVETNWKDE